MASHIEMEGCLFLSPETTEEKNEDFSSNEKGEENKENSETDHGEGKTSSISADLNVERVSDMSSSEESSGPEIMREKKENFETDLNEGKVKFISADLAVEGVTDISSSVESSGSEILRREAKKQNSGCIEASPQGPPDVTSFSTLNSDAGTDLDAVSSIDQTIDSNNSEKEDQNSEPDPDESSYQSSPRAVLETTSSSISTDSDESGIEWHSSDNNARETKNGNSVSIQASPQEPLDVTSSNSNSDVSTDVDAVSSIDQSTDSKNSEKEDQNSEPDPDESSYQSSPRAVLETTSSSISTDSDSSGIEWQSSNNNGKEETKLAHKPHADGTTDTSIGSTTSMDSDTTKSGQALTSKLRPHRDASGQWRTLISGLITRKKKLKSMVRAETFPATPGTGRGPNLKWCLERLKNVREEKISAIMPEEKFRPSWRSFDYQELLDATDGFSEENLLGKGGHAEVFKGQLQDGQLVAVKRLTKGRNVETRMGDFLSELGIIAHVNHPNAAQLLGFNAEEGLHMVLKFSPHGSLASLLHGSKEVPEWKIRYNIAIGIAEGLHYLHKGCHRRIIHRDIKASNILLTEDYQPQISDFGLAKWLPDGWPHHIVFPIEGTFGYLAPEYFMHGVVNEKTDVFAYGVILLELITGRRAVDSSRQSLVIWAKPLLDQNKVKDLVDPFLGNSYDMKEMDRLIMVASMCIHHTSTARPSMNSVLKLLKGEEESVELMRGQWKPKVSRPPIVDACEVDDYTSSRYLNDLNRYKQLALE